MNKIYVKIDGIQCENCIDTITCNLLKEKNIKKVSIDKNISTIYYLDNINKDKIIDIINSIGYYTCEEYISYNLDDLNDKHKVLGYIIFVTLFILVIFLLNKILGFNIFNFIPNIDSSITYGMLFITGVLTSIHCISMCGAINLITSLNTKKSIKRPLLYNLGRVISYSLLGGFVGLLGSLFSINKYVSGVLIILVSLTMLYYSLSIMGVFRIKNLNIGLKKKSRNPFIIGLLNGFMPCGPLQAMQLYALSTGSFITGFLSMFLFSLGTVPLMLFVSTVVNFLNNKKRTSLSRIAPALILVLSLLMLNRGLLTLNIDLFKVRDNSKYEQAVIVDDYQVIEFDLGYDNYKDILLKKDVKARIVIYVDSKYLTGCNNEIIINKYGIDKKLEVGDNIIEFTPDETGIFTYSCWMNMIKNNIKVVD